METNLNTAAVNCFHKKNKAVTKIQKQFIKHKQRAKLLAGVRKYINKIKTMEKVISKIVVKVKDIKLNFFKMCREHVNKIKEDLKKQLEDKAKKESLKQKVEE